jgi:RimJ/RimL family protein N-acetyltransferase
VPVDWFEPRPLSDAGLIGPEPRLRLEPLRPEHAEAFLAAASDHADEVFAHLSYDPPTTPAEARAVIERLNAPADQIPYAVIDVGTGDLIGTTSFYEITPAVRSLAIGYTWIARRWWRSWVNTSAKLIMLRRAFGELGAERVVWHTDIRNTRSQNAILRLGATREGVLRHHRIRRDGSWRDTVIFSMLAAEWPAAELRLIDRLARHPGDQPTDRSTERVTQRVTEQMTERMTERPTDPVTGSADTGSPAAPRS